jgi:hypothetical protein
LARILNRAAHACATTGTGTVTLGAALGAVSPNVCSWQTFGTSGVNDGEVVSYLILDSNGAWEYGTGTYTAAGTTLSRTLGKSSTGSLLSLTASSQVYVTARREDIAKIAETNTFTADQILMAGTTALAPLKFTSGTSLTTPAAGAMEYDGTCHYATHAASERGVLVAEQWIRLSAAYTLTSQTAAQKLFNSSTNGAVTVAGSTTFEFELDYNLTAKASSFAIGGTATLTSTKWKAQILTTAVDVASAAGTTTWSASAAPGNIFSPGTTTVCSVNIKGIICVNAGGTIIPQITQTTAAAAIVGINSFFKIWPIGTNTQTTLGNWS